MPKLYLTCAVVGGTLFLLQLLLGAIGHGGHADTDASDLPDGGVADDLTTDGHGHMTHAVVDHDHAFWGLLSFRAIVAGMTIFGLSGLAVHSTATSAALTAVAAVASGLATLLLTAFVLRSMVKLTDDGTMRIERSVGAAGTVYVSIPAENGGLGKVHLYLQNRTVELEAITYAATLETGTPVVVTAVVGPGTVEVIAQPQMRKFI